MKNIKAVFKREFRAYFDSPVAYVFLTAFLVLIGFLTFGVAMFYERRQADLTPYKYLALPPSNLPKASRASSPLWYVETIFLSTFVPCNVRRPTK